MSSRIKDLLLGKPKNLEDPGIFHRVSLIAFLAWVGLGADGLSSSAYGPEEAFKTLGEHTFLAVGLAGLTALTVFIISYAYTRIIEHFPFGGGGYVVASRLLGETWGLISGSALLVDYVLTITTSVASGANQIYSFLPAEWTGTKVVVEAMVLGILVLMNLRGVRESVTILAPIFVIFLITHAIALALAIGGRLGETGAVVEEVKTGYAVAMHGDAHGLGSLGFIGMWALLLKAYSLGGGTYTGIEAVSNGLQIMREPKVETGKRTMLYMAISLAVTAGGIILAYLLLHVRYDETGHETMNARMLTAIAGTWQVGGVHVGKAFVIGTLVAEGALLFVAAQAGFVDGPRVMANMAHDSWLPHRFGSLSDRLTMQDGVVLMGAASLATLLYTRGNVDALVTMYSINVFVTFSLSQLGMTRYWFTNRKKFPDWSRHIAIHLIGFVMCASILAITVREKFYEGGWLTVVVTSILVILCILIKRHYLDVRGKLKRLDEILEVLPQAQSTVPLPLDKTQPTAAILVSGFSGLGVHLILNIQRVFPGYFKNVVFISVGVIDSATFTDQEEVERVKKKTEEALQKYVDLCRGLNIAATWRSDLGTEPVATAIDLGIAVAKEFPRTVFFSGKLVFEQERWFQRLLHNETAYAIQRRLQFAGQQAMVLPVRVLEDRPASAAA
jgi:amino acid transporter